MTQDDRNKLIQLVKRHNHLGISEQIDFQKFYLYSIIAHSTAIEGSTVTELEAQLLFDEGIGANKPMIEQLMNLDLKAAYEYGAKWIKQHAPITVEWLITLASKVMARTGGEYNSMAGSFSAARGDLRKLNVSAGLGGPSYLSYQKVPSRLAAFCEELNKRRMMIDPADIGAVYDLSFWAHYELVTIHPWADGNGRTARLLMNLLQMEHELLPVKVLKEDKAEYIRSLADSRHKDDVNIFLDCMTRLHIKHLRHDIDLYLKSTEEEMVDKTELKGEILRKWSIKPSLADKLADILLFMADKEDITTEALIRHFGFAPTTAKRYLRQLTEFGYLEPQGANKNRTYRKINISH